MSEVCDLVRSGLPYIATHPDLNCPVEGGFIPDIGAIMAFIKASTGRDPDVVVGKPNKPMVEMIADRIGVPSEKMVMVGDRLYTDIAMGQHGLKTILTLSGETKMEDITGSSFSPDLVIDSVKDLFP
jgi:HAD superfamily hydrolase (TIGR01450 family)